MYLLIIDITIYSICVFVHSFIIIYNIYIYLWSYQFMTFSMPISLHEVPSILVKAVFLCHTVPHVLCPGPASSTEKLALEANGHLCVVILQK